VIYRWPYQSRCPHHYRWPRPTTTNPTSIPWSWATGGQTQPNR